jgi:hypothetical protein
MNMILYYNVKVEKLKKNPIVLKFAKKNNLRKRKNS